MTKRINSRAKCVKSARKAMKRLEKYPWLKKARIRGVKRMYDVSSLIYEESGKTMSAWPPAGYPQRYDVIRLK